MAPFELKIITIKSEAKGRLILESLNQMFWVPHEEKVMKMQHFWLS